MKRARRHWKRDVVAAAALGVALAIVVAIVRSPRATGTAVADASLTRGQEYLVQFRARIWRPASVPSIGLRTDALQALYLARVESGLGSPFRAIEAVLRDPWLPDSIRPIFASALLARTLSVTRTVPGYYAMDSVHAALVDSVVAAHPEPRRGEEIVRVGFDLAAASGAITQGVAAAAAELAAVARDASYARRDVARLVVAAHNGGLSPLDLLPMWRAERRFEVEAPIVYPIGWASSRELVANAARLFDLLDAHVARESDGARDESAGRAPLAIDVALRQAARQIARERAAPPSPAILQVASTIPQGRLATALTNDEELSAAWLSIASLTPSDQRALARAVIAAAVRLRTGAQDPVWFAGDHASRAIELHERHGLREITFAAGLRPAWREYALHSIDRALTDARRVFPDLDLRGLRIHVGVKADWPARALALHDPETRTIYFPLGSAPGVLAHEIGHDLDWQVARSVFGERGIYATDGTARRASPILAAPVERLTGASAARGPNAVMRHTPNTRPTEVLARHVDWIVAAALATMGRSNGFLSTVQEGGDALGNASAPEPGQIDAAVSVVSAATRVPGGTVAQVHAGGAGDMAPLVRIVATRALATSIRMPWTRRTTSAFDVLAAVPEMFRQATDPRLARRCVAAASRAAGEPDWVADVYALVADARARDVIRRLQQGAPHIAMRRPWSNSLRGSLAAGPVDPALRARSAALLQRDIEWQLSAAMLPPLAQATQAGGSLRCEAR